MPHRQQAARGQHTTFFPRRGLSNPILKVIYVHSNSLPNPFETFVICAASNRNGEIECPVNYSEFFCRFKDLNLNLKSRSNVYR